ncbi:hypothetical protein DAPPUDRAFT_341378 [Daphnia pulex]|uniref:Uncharacterized protein n=1 Tax=Daphnia pulex TaxID=6669 RepID=E9I5D3_DAPPU|nr:hypothetical protein DAPPUDRAFT_341378 [Daphnia pulex]|eukprot:EFX60797.1 hypothetical protein DAPPUDRAFT_341378 [Daphnia pulex]
MAQTVVPRVEVGSHLEGTWCSGGRSDRGDGGGQQRDVHAVELGADGRPGGKDLVAEAQLDAAVGVEVWQHALGGGVVDTDEGLRETRHKQDVGQCVHCSHSINGALKAYISLPMHLTCTLVSHAHRCIRCRMHVYKHIMPGAHVLRGTRVQ